MTRPRHDKWHYQGICLNVMEETQIYLLKTDGVPGRFEQKVKTVGSKRNAKERQSVLLKATDLASD
jgi:hypothetical protein